MPLTKEQLLMPRYLCTGTPGKPLWPGYHHKHGDIITNVSQVWINTMANEAPHLFKPLQWWEYRKPEEMPEYVKSHETGRVYKRYDTDSYKGFDPATREEYENHLNKKQ